MKKCCCIPEREFLLRNATRREKKKGRKEEREATKHSSSGCFPQDLLSSYICRLSLSLKKKEAERPPPLSPTSPVCSLERQQGRGFLGALLRKRPRRPYAQFSLSRAFQVRRGDPCYHHNYSLFYLCTCVYCRLISNRIKGGNDGRKCSTINRPSVEIEIAPTSRPLLQR